MFEVINKTHKTRQNCLFMCRCIWFYRNFTTIDVAKWFETINTNIASGLKCLNQMIFESKPHIWTSCIKWKIFVKYLVISKKGPTATFYHFSLFAFTQCVYLFFFSSIKWVSTQCCTCALKERWKARISAIKGYTSLFHKLSISKFLLFPVHTILLYSRRIADSMSVFFFLKIHFRDLSHNTQTLYIYLYII